MVLLDGKGGLVPVARPGRRRHPTQVKNGNTQTCAGSAGVRLSHNAGEGRTAETIVGGGRAPPLDRRSEQGQAAGSKTGSSLFCHMYGGGT